MCEYIFFEFLQSSVPWSVATMGSAQGEFVNVKKAG